MSTKTVFCMFPRVVVKLSDSVSHSRWEHHRRSEKGLKSWESDEDKEDENVIYEHELEAWTVVCTPATWSAQYVFSGGDDAAIIGPTFHNKRIHQAGVTAILPLMDGIIATGSYDDHLRIIRLPNEHVRRPEVLHEINLGGGVWRLKALEKLPVDTTDKFGVRVLVSCMYAGAYIVHLSGARMMEIGQYQ